MKTLLTALAALAIFASPSSAQSIDPDNGTGNVLAFSHKPISQRHSIQPMLQPGADSFASVSRFQTNPNEPALTGGGSVGYNENLRNNY